MKAQQRTETDSLVPQGTSRRAILGLALGGLALLAGLEVTTAKPKRKPKRQAKKGKGKLESSRRRKPKPKPKPKFKVITRTFSNASPMSISATSEVATPYGSEIMVAGFKQGKLLDVNVTLSGFSHTYPTDVDVLLRAPNGRSAVIMSDVGSSVDVSNLTLVLDDQAAASLPVGSQLGSGTFKPTNEGLDDAFPPPAAPSPDVALAIFNGSNPNGSWRLYVVDDYAKADGGSFAGGWSLTIKARVRV